MSTDLSELMLLTTSFNVALLWRCWLYSVFYNYRTRLISKGYLAQMKTSSFVSSGFQYIHLWDQQDCEFLKAEFNLSACFNRNPRILLIINPKPDRKQTFWEITNDNHEIRDFFKTWDKKGGVGRVLSFSRHIQVIHKLSFFKTARLPHGFWLFAAQKG